ncbi:MAG: hypothetical protein DMG01_25670 [Acidobacteria bacterium]|nr:MAG: hypothetical protein DMG01_25670 [Acidobacteriota bacterium]
MSHTSPCLFAGDDPIAVQAADFDGDGRVDLAVVSGAAQGLRIFKGQGDGTFVQVMTNQAGGSVPGSFVNATAMAAPVDLDGNGTFDLVVAHSTGVHVFLGNGDGTFRDGGSAGGGNPTSAVATGDLNADGIPDIASVESNDGRLLVDFALGDGTFSTQTIATIGPGLSDVAIADIDSDGRADLLVAHQSGGTIRIFFGSDSGAFVANPPLLGRGWRSGSRHHRRERGRRERAALDRAAGPHRASGYDAPDGGADIARRRQSRQRNGRHHRISVRQRRRDARRVLRRVQSRCQVGRPELHRQLEYRCSAQRAGHVDRPRVRRGAQCVHGGHD